MAIIASTPLFVVAGVLEMEVWARILFIALGAVVCICGIYVAAALDMDAGTFECRHCAHRFVPSAGEYLAAAHTPTKRNLKCPACGKKSYCKRRLTH